MLPYIPKFTCPYCKEDKEAFIEGERGLFIPCQCEEARKNTDRDQYIRNERIKQARRNK